MRIVYGLLFSTLAAAVVGERYAGLMTIIITTVANTTIRLTTACMTLVFHKN